jgi:hypothetical protein
LTIRLNPDKLIRIKDILIKESTMIKGKTVQIPGSPEFISKLSKAQKELKASSMAECGRMLLEYVLENDISGLRERVKKAELEKQAQKIDEQLQHIQAQKAKLEKELEALSA